MYNVFNFDLSNRWRPWQSPMEWSFRSFWTAALFQGLSFVGHVDLHVYYIYVCIYIYHVIYLQTGWEKNIYIYTYYRYIWCCYFDVYVTYCIYNASHASSCSLLLRLKLLGRCFGQCLTARGRSFWAATLVVPTWWSCSQRSTGQVSETFGFWNQDLLYFKFWSNSKKKWVTTQVR